jgi:opacity protein-like surface antigen
MKKIIAITLLSAALVTPAFAAGIASTSPTTPFYAGVLVGDGFTILGGYQIDKMISLEADYTTYGGRSTINNCGVNNCGNYYDYTSFGVFGVATIPLTLKGALPISLFGKVGVVRTTATSRVAGYNYSASDIGLGIGGGAQYDFNKRLSARLGLNINYYYANNLYIGAIFKF